MSLNQLFELSRRSFRTYDAAMQTTSDNIANAGVEGYHRRRITRAAESSASPGVVIPPPHGRVVGTGVSVQSYERLRDVLVEQQSRQARGDLGGAREEARLLSAVEGVFATGDENNLTGVLGRFFDAWGQVADHPTDRGVRTALLQEAESLAHSFRRLDADLDAFAGQTQQALGGSVDRVNGLLARIADANVAVREARFNGSPDLAAEDARDRHVRELAELMPVRVEEGEQGYTVTSGGLTLVQEDAAERLELFDRDGDNLATDVRLAGTDVVVRPPAEGGGALGAQLRTLHQTLPTFRENLDALAADLSGAVNAEHAGGYALDGTPGGAFFAGATAGTLEVAVTDPAAVAAAGDAGGASAGPGDSTQARALAALGEGFTGEAVDLMAAVGARAQAASSRTGAQQAVVDHLDGLAAGVSGVSLDEEMTNLIQHQQAFQASARVLTTAQTMMDTLLRL